MSSAVINRIKLANAKRQVQLQSQVLFNASDEIVDFTVGADPAGCFPFTIPPDGPYVNADGQEVVGDGELRVYDHYGIDPAILRAAKKDKRDVSQLPRNKLILSAITVIEHASKKLEKRGVIVLSGEPQEDKLLKAEAKKLWIQFRKVEAEKTIKRYRERVAAYTRDPGNAGMPAPRMEENETKAQMWLDEYRLGNIGHKAFVCKFRECGFQTDDAVVMERHMRASHPFAAEADKTDAALRRRAAHQEPPDEDPDDEEQPVVRKRKRRKRQARRTARMASEPQVQDQPTG